MDLVNGLEKACLKHNGMDKFYISEYIPDKNLKNAKKHFRIPNDIEVIGIYDGTVFGSNKTGFAICGDGIYWDNGFSEFSGGGHIIWEEFRTARIALKEKNESFVQVGDSINIFVSFPKNNHRVLALLLDIQSYINNTDAFYPENDIKEEMQVSVTDSSILSSNAGGMDVADKNSGELIDLNTASLEELLVLPGFSIDEASLLIKERNVRSGFIHVDEIFEFLDIKPHLVDQIKSKVTVSILPKTEKMGRVIDY